MRNLIYLSPELYDLSQGTRIKFVRLFRHLTQDNVSDDLGLTEKIKEEYNLTMGLLPTVELSFLSKYEQQVVYSAITYEDVHQVISKQEG